MPTKSSINRYSVVNYPLQEVYDNLRNAAERALRKLSEFKCLEMPEYSKLVTRYMCPNQVNMWEKLGIERLDEFTVVYQSDDFADVWAQLLGWAPGVHRKKYNLTPEWKHPHTLAREAFKE